MVEKAKTAAKSAAKKAVAKKPATTKSSVKVVDPTLKTLLESGAHFGHRVERWNPKMKPYIYGQRGGVYIIDLTKTYEQLKIAESFIENVTKNGGQVLFVGTKRQAQGIIQKAATDAGMPYVIHRWLGGMLTNLETIRTQITRLKKLQSQTDEGSLKGTKKEKAMVAREVERLQKTFAGVADMEQLPAALFVVDMPREDIAIAEAGKLGIPVVAIADTNANPELVQYPIAANDDAIKTVSFITERIANAAKSGAEAYRAKAADKLEQEKSQEDAK